MYKNNLIIPALAAVSILFLLAGGCEKNQEKDQLKGYSVDLNHDGKNEIIRINRLEVEVFGQDNKKLGDFDIVDYSDKLEFIDLNKDGQKQIAVWSQGKEGFSRSLAIYALKNKQIEEIFKVEASGEIEVNFYALQPWVKSGWATWVWDGEQFVQ